MKVVTKTQRDPEWVAARMGVPSASNFNRILTPTGNLSSQSWDYAYELAAERHALYLPEDAEFIGTRAMRYGTETEPEARRWYVFHCGLEVEEVGFCTTDDGRFGCSPDGLVGADGLLELKCPLGKTHVSYLVADVLPLEYFPQVHGQLLVTGRKWVDFVSYCPGLPPFVKRVEVEPYTMKLAAALEQFHERYLTVLRHLEELRGRA